jgi:nucleoside-diphosphate-sugar epimerase
LEAKQQVFITGISSLLMQKLVKNIDPQYYNIVGLSRKHAHVVGAKVIQGNLQDNSTWAAAAANANLVIHAAGITHSYNEQDYFDINTKSSISFLAHLKKQQHPAKIVYISSRAAEPASGAYGLSKLKTEKYIQQNFKEYLILKPSEIFGGEKNEGIDQFFDNLKTKKLIVCPSHRQAPMAPISITDAVALLKYYIFDTKTSGVYTINGADKWQLKEIAEWYAMAKNKKLFIITLPKFFLVAISYVFKLFAIKGGIYPDQVKRLYCIKKFEKPAIAVQSVKDYLSTLE